MPNVNASMNAASPRMAPAMAVNGDSFSSSRPPVHDTPQQIPGFDGHHHDDDRPSEHSPEIGRASMRIGHHPRFACAVT